MKFSVMPRILLLIFSLFMFAGSVSAAVPVPKSIRQGENLKSYVWSVDEKSFSPQDFLPLFTSQTISDVTFARMKGRSFGEGCVIPRSDLRYLILPHYDGHGFVRIGEMVVNKAIAADVVAIFLELFKNRYPIERMVLIDDYDADDERSMAANNTSGFNFRRVAGSKKLSPHARGMAVDINPLYNPMVRTRRGKTTISPSAGAPYVRRSHVGNPYLIDTSDLAYRLFRARGFSWGGAWRTVKDYQHFQK